MNGLKQIALGREGSVWGIGKTDGKVVRLYGDAGFVGWGEVSLGLAEVVAPANWAEAWCVNQAHQIWYAHYGDNNANQAQWTQIPTASGAADAQTISVGPLDGTVWYAQTDGRLFHREGAEWLADPTGRAVALAAVSQTDVWCLNAEHEIWRLQHGSWARVPDASSAAKPSLPAAISASADGTVWYASLDGTLYERHKTSWQATDGSAVSLAVGSKDSIWCVNSAGDAFNSHYDGAWVKFEETTPIWGYVVQRGDGLYGIIRKQFGITDPKELERLAGLIASENHLADRNHIAAGATLTLASL